ncbi:hypothetical protein ACWDUI_36815, partial [Streptosporangium sandarakinum]
MLGAPDVSRVGALGQSLGGSVAAQLTREDARVDAGVNLDGAYVGPVATYGVTRPFLQLAADTGIPRVVRNEFDTAVHPGPSARGRTAGHGVRRAPGRRGTARGGR